MLFFAYKPIFFAKMLLEIIPNVTIEMELKGIKIAAMTGDNCPVTAKYNPITL